ncbi:hypothetical protein CVT24_012065 [Panaeolus cyanescens]|uniref:RING-type domain-containing protein n=1 Tax=Panaeolus cyanescens TaxID=181874 RepID=A0A409VHV3_9AGAR|nr:hypothetical protein CVT24_012065 [Panaeolus cyanescens]
MEPSSDLLVRRCNICYTAGIPINRIRFFECGHWCCVKCLDQSNKERVRKCGTCRQPRGTGFKIFLAAEDLVDDQIQKKADADLSIIEPEDPSFTMGSSQARALVEELAEVKGKYEELQKENNTLSELYQTCDSERSSFHQQAAGYRHRVHKLGDELSEKKTIIQGYVKERLEHLKEIEKLKEEIKSKDQISLTKAKMRAMAGSSRPKRKATKDADTSLLVESPVRAEHGLVADGSKQELKKRIRHALQDSKDAQVANHQPSNAKRRKES